MLTDKQFEIDRLYKVLDAFGIPRNYVVEESYGVCKFCGKKLGPNNTPGVCGGCEW